MSWTWESLTTAPTSALGELMRTGDTPDIARLLGHSYQGLNRGLITRITGRRFVKVFYEREGEPFGHNVVQRRGKPRELGWFRVRPDGRAALIDYDVEQNRGLALPVRLLKDHVVLPNPGDHELVLGKARYLGVHMAYFVLRRDSGSRP